jgi:phytoene dehydrogenase-like protein
VTTTPYDAVLIGAGHNSLVTAGYLARAGLRAVVLERRTEPGGALASADLSGVTVPVVADNVGALLPSVISDLRLAAHGFEALRPEAQVWAPQPDGSSITLWSDPDRTAAELRSHHAADAAAYPPFDRLVLVLGAFLARLNATTPPDLKSPSVADALSGLKLGRAVLGLAEADLRTLLRVYPMAVADFVAEHFHSELVRAVVATRGVRYAAVGPWSAGTTGILLGSGGGAAGRTAFARGGPAALVRALIDAATAFGAEIRTDVPVARITSDRDGHATGVVLSSGEELAARAVVSGTDPKRTLTELVDPAVVGPTLRWRANNIRMPGVVAKVNLVLARAPDFVGAHEEDVRRSGRIVFASTVDALERAHDATKYGRVAESPYMEATIPTLHDPTLATRGRHVMSVLIQYAPYHRREGDWDADRDNFGDLVLKNLDAYAPGIADLVEERQVLTPVDLERDYGLTEGHPLHGEPTLDQFFAWRPLLGHARYRFGIEGLYLCGSGAHPGGGVTGAPGANAAREIIKDLKRAR